MTIRKESRIPLSVHLDNLEARCLEENLTLQNILEIFGTEGHHVLIIFLTIPFLQPIPLPGLSTLFGFLIVVVASLAYLRKPPWIPKKWAEKKIEAKIVTQIAESSKRIFVKLAFMIHPRLNFLFQGPFRSINTLLVIANAILLALPLPVPFSNAIPAWMILFQTLAHLEEDGLFVILSYIQTAICLMYFLLIAKGIGTGFDLIGSWS